MSQLQERIAQFRKMANDDPDNELGHFRLGQLFMEGGQYEEAVGSFRRTLELSPQFSKVYHLLATSLLKLNRQEEAVQVQPLPDIETNVSPAGGFSVTVTGPTVAGAPAALFEILME